MTPEDKVSLKTSASVLFDKQDAPPGTTTIGDISPTPVLNFGVRTGPEGSPSTEPASSSTQFLSSHLPRRGSQRRAREAKEALPEWWSVLPPPKNAREKEVNDEIDVKIMQERLQKRKQGRSFKLLLLGLFLAAHLVCFCSHSKGQSESGKTTTLKSMFCIPLWILRLTSL